MSPAAPPLPELGDVAAAMLDLGRELHLELSEAELADRFLTTLAGLFPHRRIALRVLDPRTREPARVYALGGELRPGLESDRVTIKESAVEKTRLKTAVAASARLRLGTRWDSPFSHVAAGFTVPLVASGELYGVLDLGYALGHDLSAVDEPLVLPVANQLALALRNQRLWRDAQGLRDFQTRLIEHANALIIGIDRSWRVTVCNRALLELTGCRRDEVVGQDLRDLLPDDQRPRLTPIIAAAMRGHTQDAVEAMIAARPRGRVRTVWSLAAIGADHGGSDRPTAEAVVAIGQDQTRLRELQDQVIQAERLATLGQLAAGVVHELNNPLTSISVYAEYLLRKAERAGTDAGDVEKLSRIGQSAQRILRFARELVQYAKPVGYEIDVVDLNAVVRQSLGFCEHLFDRGGIEVSLELDPALPPVPAIPGQLEQVLINLLTNAAHAVEGGGAVAVRTGAGPGQTVQVTVDDSGPGIAAEDRERIFEPFFTTKVDGKGTGLGLPIVKNIVEQHRGSIGVDRAPAGGARFVVTLPRQPA
ncbi:MAG: PAS domain-containing protein [Kofleriaceae bacterium]|nr:PAS domain-containing protein [Kofleriaceae bacterium]MCL4227193.1 PAS domain-containing protein [Myxococcales bacterium]